MTVEQIKAKLKTEEYDFLRTDPHLGENIILLGICGSHGYGVNTEHSDIDCRLIALNSKKEILTGRDFGTINNEKTDTVVHSFNKIIRLLSECNPGCIELLGLKPEHYMYIHPIAQEILDNRKMFLSQIASVKFGGYSRDQLYRIKNSLVRDSEFLQRLNHILKVIVGAKETFPRKYFDFKQDCIKLYVDEQTEGKYKGDIFMDINLTHYPLRDYKSMWSEMHNIVRDYDKLGKRNHHAMMHDKLNKHMCSLVQMYYICFDILEKEEIITYREAEHDLLMSIRNRDYLDSKGNPIPEFYEMVDELEKRLEYAKQNTSLPETPDYKKIDEFVVSVNERVVRGEI